MWRPHPVFTSRGAARLPKRCSVVVMARGLTLIEGAAFVHRRICSSRCFRHLLGDSHVQRQEPRIPNEISHESEIISGSGCLFVPPPPRASPFSENRDEYRIGIYQGTPERPAIEASRRRDHGDIIQELYVSA